MFLPISFCFLGEIYLENQNSCVIILNTLAATQTQEFVREKTIVRCSEHQVHFHRK